MPFGPLLVMVALLATVAIGVLGFRGLLRDRNAAIGLAEIQSRNLAQAIDQNLSRMFQNVDSGMQAVVFELETGGSREHVEAVIAAEKHRLPCITALRCTDPEGWMIAGRLAQEPIASVRARPYFAQAREGRGLFVTPPVMGILQRQWIVVLARRYNLPDGRFGGVVLATLPLSGLQGALAGFDPGPKGFLEIRSAGDTFMNRIPASMGPDGAVAVGDPRSSDPLRAVLATGVRQQTYFSHCPIDGIPRTVSFRRLEAAPMFVLAGLAEEDYLGLWQRGRTRLLATLGAGLAGFWLLVLVLWRFWVRHEAILGALRDSEEQTQALLSAIPDLIFVNGPDGRYLAYHAHDPGLLLVPPEVFMNRTVQEILPEPMASRIRSAHAEAFARGEVQQVEYSLRINGGDHDFEARIAPCGPSRVLTLVRDITARRSADLLKARLQAQQHQAQKMESLGGLASGVAHDMNNVLGAILALSEANLQSLPGDSILSRSFETIGAAATRGAATVRGLLHFARETPGERRLLDLNTLLREQTGLLGTGELAGLAVDLRLAPDLRPIRGDGDGLAQAFQNLIVNAVEAMEGLGQGGTLTLATSNAGDQVQVMVTDTGRGMTRAVLDRALDPFFTTKGVKGSGLGLSLAFKTVTAHGGQLELASVPGQGTQVKMLFPAAASPESGPSPSGAAGTARVLHVMVVDDDELMLEASRILAEALGHRVSTFFSGEEGLAALEGGLQPDVVLLDMNMPGLGGQGTLPRLRVLRPQLPACLATGRTDQSALDLVAAHPFVSLLPKPYGLEALRAMLAQVVQADGGGQMNPFPIN